MQTDVERPLSILLKADPGVGKTFLAQKLAEAVKFQGGNPLRLIQHDITQMIHRGELLDLFDSVAMAQAEKDDPVVVFVDEINATLDASPVYGAFLSPLEGGYYYYMRRGMKFKLKPCIWIFAQTSTEQPYEEVEKFTDFISRITHQHASSNRLRGARKGGWRAPGQEEAKL